MKFNLKEHPMIFLVLMSVLMLIVSLYLGVTYHFNMYSVIAIVISGLGTVCLLGYTIYDLVDFLKKKEQYDKSQHNNDQDKTDHYEDDK
ncbi:MAG: hypothetical protein WCS80_00995 [Bacilli bacterium]